MEARLDVRVVVPQGDASTDWSELPGVITDLGLDNGPRDKKLWVAVAVRANGRVQAVFKRQLHVGTPWREAKSIVAVRFRIDTLIPYLTFDSDFSVGVGCLHTLCQEAELGCCLKTLTKTKGKHFQQGSQGWQCRAGLPRAKKLAQQSEQNTLGCPAQNYFCLNMGPSLLKWVLFCAGLHSIFFSDCWAKFVSSWQARPHRCYNTAQN